MIVLSQECDLITDWKFRQGIAEGAQIDEAEPAVIPHLLLCDLYEESRIRGPKMTSEPWRRIRQNQDERYHHLEAGQIGGSAPGLPDLFIDCKKVFGLPISNVYAGIGVSQIKRVAVLPPFHLHDMIHRLFAFQSRVAVPE
jgi:hypothetical protein